MTATGLRTGRRSLRPRWPRVSSALALLVALYAIAAFAEPLAAYGSDEQHRDVSYAPPTWPHLVDARGQWHLVPFVHPLVAIAGTVDRYREDTGISIPVRFFSHGAPYMLAGIIRADRHLVGVDEPGHLFLIGADRYGRDLFARLLAGARLSLFAGLIATLLALGIATSVGGLSGFYGGRLDDTLMWLSNLFAALPWVYLLLAVRSILPLDLSPARTFLAIVSLMGLLGWARPARIIRTVALSERGRDYVVAARSCGARDRRILFRHVLPQAASVVLTQAAIMLPACVLGEITLSFLGLGLSEPTPSWGTLAAGMLPPGLVVTHWWLATPAAAMVPVFAICDRVAHQLAGTAGVLSAGARPAAEAR